MNDSKYLEEVIRYERKTTDLQMEAAATALKLQVSEYERRLELLNNEARQLKDMQATYLPREIHDNFVKDITDKIAVLSRLVYIGLGLVIAIETLLKFIK